jgi:cell division protein FtsW
MFLVALGLSLLGLVMVYSATYREYGMDYLYTRLLHLGLGVAVFVVVSQVRYTSWRRFAPHLYFTALVTLVLVLIPGIGMQVGGARRWIDLGPLSFQPAELAKLAAVVALSCAVSRVRPGSGLPGRALAAVGILFVLVLVEPDFGTSVVFLAGVAGVLWASEVRTADLVLAGLGCLGALVIIMLLEPYRRERMMTFLDPYAVADGPGYQVVQSMIAIKSGSLFGTGAGAGGQAAVVPEVRTDMIFALIGEEFGLLGMVAVIIAFGFLVAAGFRIALSAPTVLGRCMAAGLTTMISVQTIFNIGATMVVLPLAGMTLPFISYGGSSLIVCFAAIGILYRISEDSERVREIKQRPRSSAQERAADPDRGRRYGRTRDPRAMRGG